MILNVTVLAENLRNVKHADNVYEATLKWPEIQSETHGGKSIIHGGNMMKLKCLFLTQVKPYQLQLRTFLTQVKPSQLQLRTLSAPRTLTVETLEKQEKNINF